MWLLQMLDQEVIQVDTKMVILSQLVMDLGGAEVELEIQDGLS